MRSVESGDRQEGAAMFAGRLKSADTVGRYRWVVCGLLFLSTSLCYLDRQIFGLLKPLLVSDLAWTETNYGDVVAVFALMYAIGYLLAGRAIDRIGTRRGLSVAVAGWSLAAAAHGLAGSVLGFKLARGALGLMEGGNFPASIKTVREWFPVHERAFATGLFNAGSNVGAIITPLALPFVVAAFGWRTAFFMAGFLGVAWLIAWLIFYEAPEKQRRLSVAERAYILGDAPAPEVRQSWVSLLRRRGTWAFVCGMLITGPVWWFYLNWVPGYLHSRFGVDMMQSIVPIVAIYLTADVGSIIGGWLSSRLVSSGLSPVKARLLAILIMAICTLPVGFISLMPGIWAAVGVIALAAAGHQGVSANLYTLVSDTMPAGSVSSVVGIGGFAAGIAGMFTALAIGRILDATHGNYLVLFIGAAAAYPLAGLIMGLILNDRSGRSSIVTE
ncbi:MFS transporter [Asticcacaulis sp. AC466]|uniref:MFS transporter n=1 Tax=Asticcacaulis sp. AC466 TaxID=1282362 RepID=UPI00190F6841|nr:MFS transporter [Asticcacaulis sp. AC466]